MHVHLEYGIIFHLKSTRYRSLSRVQILNESHQYKRGRRINPQTASDFDLAPKLMTAPNVYETEKGVPRVSSLTGSLHVGASRLSKEI